MPDSASGGSRSFRKVVAAFLASAAMPFARILSAERVEGVVAKHDGLFGRQEIYSTAMMVWSLPDTAANQAEYPQQKSQKPRETLRAELRNQCT